MEQNQEAHRAFAPEADEAAALPHWPGASWTAAPAAANPPPEDEHDFASEAEATAYWQGLADGIRQSGGIVPARLAARLKREEEGFLVPVHGDSSILPGTGRGTAREASGGGGPPLGQSDAGEAGPLRQPCGLPPPRAGEDQLAFAPAHLRPRHDGWTPEKQIAFVEALAETGVVRQAAAQVGMDPRSVSRLRRRTDARAFDRACTAAARIGGRQLLSIAYERAVEGTIKRHYFHGELKAEERVYDNRLLMALIARLPAETDEADRAARDVEHNWDGWMDAIAQGRDAPELSPVPEPPTAPSAYSVFLDGGDLLTNCPPPEGFDGFQEGEPGECFYQRRLSVAEEEYWERDGGSSAGEGNASDAWLVDGPDFFARGCGLSGLSAAAAEPEDEQSDASEPSGERPARPAGGSALAEPDRCDREVDPESGQLAGTPEAAGGGPV